MAVRGRRDESGYDQSLHASALYRQVTENWFIIFIGVALAGLIGLFLYGWARRKEKPPPGVKPLKDEDDWK